MRVQESFRRNESESLTPINSNPRLARVLREERGELIIVHMTCILRFQIKKIPLIYNYLNFHSNWNPC